MIAIENISPRMIDLTGEVCGRLTVLEYAGNNARSQAQWLCRCGCGSEKVVDGYNLRKGLVQSCGCSKRLDRTGHRYGMLTALSCEGSTKDSRVLKWRCRCDCGNIVSVLANSISTGLTKSCGCRCRLPKGEASFNALYTSKKRDAKARNYRFELTKEQVRNIITQPCQYCGAEPAQVTRALRLNGDFIHNGIDRVDNDKGYLVANVVPCCKTCNYAKRTMGVEEFKAWVSRVYKHFIEGGAQ